MTRMIKLIENKLLESLEPVKTFKLRFSATECWNAQYSLIGTRQTPSSEMSSLRVGATPGLLSKGDQAEIPNMTLIPGGKSLKGFSSLMIKNPKHYAYL